MWIYKLAINKYKFIWNKWGKKSDKLLSMKFSILVCQTTICIIIIRKMNQLLSR